MTPDEGAASEDSRYGTEIVHTDRYKEVEKMYRLPPVVKRGPKPKKTDFTSVFDFQDLDANTPENRALIREISPDQIVATHFSSGLVPKIGKVYEVDGVPGFYVMPGLLSIEQQKYWVDRCAKDYIINNPTNVSNLKKTPVWSEWSPECLSPALRWATLGYHFQWTPRKYFEEFKGPFPEDLAESFSGIALQLGYPMEPQAGTINYYPVPRQMMGGHLDDAEDDLTKPIVSASFGNTVVFLIGGRTREKAPVAVWLRSGDVVLMGGESRYCYHGVPRMMENSCPPQLVSDDAVGKYISNARINLNVRQ
ncbi:hypothetical protein PROFUN_16303, partial [Planoprotostelium fungivorum]